MPMVTTFCRVVTYHEVLPPIKLHDPLTTWSSKIASHTKFLVTPLPKWL